MMISITSTSADPSGALIIDALPSSDIDTKSARISRSQTLDGGVYINNSGFSDGDRTLRISAKLMTDQADKLTHIINNFNLVCISMSDGFYTGAIQFVKKTGILYKITIYLNTRESV